MLRFCKRLRLEVNRLHRTDWEREVVLRDLVRVQRQQLRGFRHAVGQLTHTRQDSRAVGFRLAALQTHSELDCEPVDGGQPFELDFGSSQRSEAYVL